MLCSLGVRHRRVQPGLTHAHGGKTLVAWFELKLRSHADHFSDSNRALLQGAVTRFMPQPGQGTADFSPGIKIFPKGFPKESKP